MRAVVLERNPLVARKVVRLLASAGVSAVAVEDPAQLALEGIELLFADAFDGELVADAVRQKKVRGVLWTAEPLRRSLKLLETPGLDHVLARRDFESAPRGWELVMTARRLAAAAPASAAPLAAYLDWGHAALEIPVRGSADRDGAVTQIQDFVAGLHAPRRVAEMFGELAHELIMNAVYDAPTDALGRATHAHDRKADVVLAPAAQPRVTVASDGTRLALQVRDPFGRLARRHVVDGLARGLAGGELDASNGGAGLGLMLVHNAATAMFFDVAPARSTEVTALFELDLNLRELRTHARSLHLWGLA